jgi:ParB-like chromosome segregation protein Spo0J/DNA modification methylase
MSTYPIRYPEQAVLIDAARIDITGRVREDYGDVNSLADSIKDNGLIHPPVVNSNFKLIAGGRRYTALTKILALTQIPVLFLETLDEGHLRILEAEENSQRKQTTWQEDVRAVAIVHRQKTLTKALNSESWTQKMTGKLLNRSQADISNALTIATLLDKKDKEILEAATLTDALRIVIARRENEINAAIAKSTIPSMAGQIKTSPVGPHGAIDILAELAAQPQSTGTDDDFFAKAPAASPVHSPILTGIGVQGARPIELPGAVIAASPLIEVPLAHMLRCADMMNLDSLYGPKYFDHIVTDIPYGIDMSNLSQTNTGMDVSSTASEHSVEGNLELMGRMFPVWFSVLRDNSFVVLWCDITHWSLLSDRATAAGFKVQRWPLIWNKTHQCLNQSAQYNFTKNFEIAMVLRKGNATLLTPQNSSVWTGSGLNESETFGHPFAKPVKLWQWVYDAIATRGQKVLDPFMGSGSSVVAGIHRGLQCHGVELNEAHYNRAVVNVSQVYQTLTPNVRFV